MTPEVKLRTMAAQDAGLQALLSSGSPAVFRWYDVQRVQGGALPDVTVQRIGTARNYYSHSGPNQMTQARFQITIRDLSAEVTRQVADAISAFLATFDAASDAQFGSPQTTPRQFPNFVLNQHSGMDFELQPPVFVQILDVRIFTLED